MFEIKSIFFDSPLFPLQVARTESVDNFIVIRKEEIERERVEQQNRNEQSIAP